MSKWPWVTMRAGDDQPVFPEGVVREYTFEEAFTRTEHRMLDQVRRQSESDEPKCKNCGYWRLLTDGRTTSDSHGECLRAGSIMLPGYKPITTDLSLCSRWERKA